MISTPFLLNDGDNLLLNDGDEFWLNGTTTGQGSGGDNRQLIGQIESMGLQGVGIMFNSPTGIE